MGFEQQMASVKANWLWCDLLAPPQHPQIHKWTGLLHHLMSHGQGQDLNFSPPTLKACLSTESMSTFLAEWIVQGPTEQHHLITYPS